MHMSISVRSLTGSNAEFTFSVIGCLNKGKEPSLPSYFIHSGREKTWIHTFSKAISVV